VPRSQLNLIAGEAWVDLISGEVLHEYDKALHFRPYQSRWISNLMPAPQAG